MCTIKWVKKELIRHNDEYSLAVVFNYFEMLLINQFASSKIIISPYLRVLVRYKVYHDCLCFFCRNLAAFYERMVFLWLFECVDGVKIEKRLTLINCIHHFATNLINDVKLNLQNKRLLRVWVPAKNMTLISHTALNIFINCKSTFLIY